MTAGGVTPASNQTPNKPPPHPHPLSSKGGTKEEIYGLRKFTGSKKQWDKKHTVTAEILITKVYKKRCFTQQKMCSLA